MLEPEGVAHIRLAPLLKKPSIIYKKRQHISPGIYQILNGHTTIANAPASYLLYIHFNSDLYTLISAVTPRISLFSSRIG